MQQDDNDERERTPAKAGSGRRLALFGLAVAVAVLGLAALAAIALGPDSDASGAATDAASPPQRTAFALFDEFHATLIVAPGAVGTNSVDVILARHDGSGVPEVSEVTVTAELSGAGGAETAPAAPVEGSPGTYRAEIALPEPGDWELAVSVTTESGQVAETAVVPIGGR